LFGRREIRHSKYSITAVVRVVGKKWSNVEEVIRKIFLMQENVTTFRNQIGDSEPGNNPNRNAAVENPLPSFYRSDV
jgi:hypothetical protein